MKEERNLNSHQKDSLDKERILLVLLPFWTPLIPPMGIACLKSFLIKHGCNVENADANIVPHLRKSYDMYFEILRQLVPEGRRGNFFSIGQDLLRNHMMAYFNHENEREYIEFLKVAAYKTFYIPFSDQDISKLDQVVREFYENLQSYFLDLLERVKPSILGLSAYNGTLPASLFVGELTRKKYPDIKILMGGGVFADQLAVGTPNLDYFLKRTGDFIDSVFIGEGELMFLSYLLGTLPGSQKVFTLEDIDWRLLELDSVEPPDFFDFDADRYLYLAAYTSRSCPFQCKFCSETVQWGKYRKKTARQIVEELCEIYHRHGTQLIFMSDSLLNPVITELAEEFERSDTVIYWDGCIRAEKPACDTKNTFLWRRGGFYRARLGIESGSQRILNLMGKRITVEQSALALKSLALAGIKTSTLWVIGFPGETEEDFQQTLNFIEENQNYIYEAENTPFWYHLGGQSNSDQWTSQNRNVLLYPETAKHMLITQTWILEGEPSREETFERLNRFSALCERLRIPNPYSLHDIYDADERWKKLHANAVPPILEFNQRYISECRNLQEIHYLQNNQAYSGDFDI